MNEQEELKERLDKTKELLDKLDEMLAVGEITEAKYKQLSKKYRNEVENLKNQIAEGVLKQEFGIKTEEEERAEKAKHEEERLRIQREEAERRERERLKARQEEERRVKEPRAREKKEGFSQIKILAAALVLGALLLLGYWALAPGATEAPVTMKPMPTPTPVPIPLFTNSIGMEFVRIPAGEFDMGSPEGDFEEPVHRVRIVNDFYMGKYEVTQKQWRDVMRSNPSGFKGDNLPVESVSWNDVQEFIRKFNEIEGTNKYRLPSEAEWEYAARAGTTTRYSFGDDESKLGEYAWYNANSGSKTHEVGQKKPNPWGLYDMHGNVWEWVQDSWHSNYNGAPTDGSAWELDIGYGRVRRGCGWLYDTMGCRSAIRGSNYPVDRDVHLGFRLVRTP